VTGDQFPPGWLIHDDEAQLPAEDGNAPGDQ
jgi:hypothetical protein